MKTKYFKKYENVANGFKKFFYENDICNLIDTKADKM